MVTDRTTTIPFSEQNSRIILLVDGDELQREIVSSALAHQGWEVVGTASANHALALAGRCQPHAVVVDQHVQDMTGLELCWQLSRHSSTRNRIVVALSVAPSLGLSTDLCRLYGVTVQVKRPAFVEELELAFGIVESFTNGVRPPTEYTRDLVRMARSAGDSGDLQTAVELLTRAVSLEPNSACWHIELGSAQLASQDSTAAVGSLRKALAVEPFSSDVAVAVAGLFEQMGFLTLAEGAWMHALRLTAEPSRRDAVARRLEGTVRAQKSAAHG